MVTTAQMGLALALISLRRQNKCNGFG